MTRLLFRLFALLCAALLPLSLAGAAAPERKPDLADLVAGTYVGDIISDARGSSKSGVTITVTRVGKDRVAIACDCARIPKVEIPIERAMDAILASSGPHVFLIENQRDPRRLSLTIDDASLSLEKQ
ncbi:hypothetical protein [Blastomonas sp. UPD001]|jgi:hypothetical protein|uniref:hypothetical protein n=1 Tax=unclassified Blastomonas TaxID=2626550 RepID=UPI000E34DE23|nr:hypothetical protein [Blastomonas sp. UPD001]